MLIERDPVERDAEMLFVIRPVAFLAPEATRLTAFLAVLMTPAAFIPERGDVAAVALRLERVPETEAPFARAVPLAPVIPTEAPRVERVEDCVFVPFSFAPAERADDFKVVRAFEVLRGETSAPEVTRASARPFDVVVFTPARFERS